MKEIRENNIQRGDENHLQDYIDAYMMILTEEKESIKNYKKALIEIQFEN